MNDPKPSLSPRKILVLGATGPTGRHLVERALAAGHAVTAAARDPAKLPMKHARLCVVPVDVTADDARLAEATRQQDAVLCALGAGKSLEPHHLMERAMPRIVAAMEQAGVRRMILLSGFGVGETFADVPLLPKILIRTLLRATYADKAASEEILRKSALDWTILYSAGLSDAPARGHWRVGEHIPLRGFPTIPRADVAAAMLDELEAPRFLGKGALLAS